MGAQQQQRQAAQEADQGHRDPDPLAAHFLHLARHVVADEGDLQRPAGARHRRVRQPGPRPRGRAAMRHDAAGARRGGRGQREPVGVLPLLRDPGECLALAHQALVGVVEVDAFARRQGAEAARPQPQIADDLLELVHGDVDGHDAVLQGFASAVMKTAE
ncbi:MAG: hypothetical protein MZW92_34670 [Comamonadaceae bacterium]|nr:hypothetical protein [Comamonadaceae bacterium]